MAKQRISAMNALKAFSDVKVQEAVCVPTKGKDGKIRDIYETNLADLDEKHVLSSTIDGDSVTIVTIDGRRHTAIMGKSKKDEK